MGSLMIIFGWITLIVVIVFYFITLWIGKRSVSSEEEKILTHLWDVAEKIEGRLGNLERIHELDKEEWSKK